MRSPTATVSILHMVNQRSFSKAFEKYYATRNKAARQLVITEATKTYSQFPQLAQAPQEAAQEVAEFAIDLVEALGTVQRQPEDWALTLMNPRAGRRLGQ